MKIITVELLSELIRRHGFDKFIADLIEVLKQDFSRWHTFTKIPRPSMDVENGVLELMPICDNKLYYSFKYVNCHPKNPSNGLQTVVATGQLARIDSGYPLMFCEMTVLTALRTAAVAALATDLMSRKNSKIMTIIGTGAQSEFQVKALQLVRDIKEVRFFDIDAKAMDKFEKNVLRQTQDESINLVRCNNVQEAVFGADIITVCTASKIHAEIIKNNWVNSGVHINAIGGDSVGKTELELDILKRAKIVVEYFEQSYAEGEIQRLSRKDAEKIVFAELHELVSGFKKGRENEKEITLFDSVGIALEDYSALRLTYILSEKYNIGLSLNMTPVLSNAKDLISVLM